MKRRFSPCSFSQGSTPSTRMLTESTRDGPPAMSPGVEPARADVMEQAPRQTDARILNGGRLGRLFVYGFTMAVGTLALFWYTQPQGETYTLTLAFTAFVLFQFFNLFNARSEHGTDFDRQFFRNRWLSLAAVLAASRRIRSRR